MELTTEQAIKILEVIHLGKTLEAKQACSMAIEALRAIPSAEPCEDAISRQAVMDALCNDCELFRNGEQTCFTKCEEYHFLATLPPVTPQPKTGHWVKMPLVETGQTYSHKCSLCGRRILVTNAGLSEFPYCHCGARMFEPQESEK